MDIPYLVLSVIRAVFGSLFFFCFLLLITPFLFVLKLPLKIETHGNNGLKAVTKFFELLLVYFMLGILFTSYLLYDSSEYNPTDYLMFIYLSFTLIFLARVFYRLKYGKNFLFIVIGFVAGIIIPKILYSVPSGMTMELGIAKWSIYTKINYLEIFIASIIMVFIDHFLLKRQNLRKIENYLIKKRILEKD